MRIALISDVHGNMIALQAVLAELHRSEPDHVICLGDVATLGPNPREAIVAVQKLGCRCIMGNHDEFLIDPQLVHTYDTMPIVVESIEWCRNQLSESELISCYIRAYTRCSIEFQRESPSVSRFSSITHGSTIGDQAC
jgi:3',5'-cyclic AMP phosphodiesterase CpdA